MKCVNEYNRSDRSRFSRRKRQKKTTKKKMLNVRIWITEDIQWNSVRRLRLHKSHISGVMLRILDWRDEQIFSVIPKATLIFKLYSLEWQKPGNNSTINKNALALIWTNFEFLFRGRFSEWKWCLLFQIILK